MGLWSQAEVQSRTLYLAYVGIRDERVGFLLWPAVVAACAADTASRARVVQATQRRIELIRRIIVLTL